MNFKAERGSERLGEGGRGMNKEEERASGPLETCLLRLGNDIKGSVETSEEFGGIG